MKLQLLSVLLVVASSYALPRDNEVDEPNNEANAVEYRIRRFIKLISMRIEKAGLDPFEVERKFIEINPEYLDLVVKGFVENVRFTGASDIRINTLEYNYLLNTIRLDVSLPKINLTVDDSGLEAIVVGKKIYSQLNGSLSLNSIRVAGVGYVDVNQIGAIRLRSVLLNCSIGGIESDLSVVAQGTDNSEFVNTLLNNRIPVFLENHKDDINRVLENILSVILNISWSY